MHLFKNWFIVKRPKISVLQRSNEYEEKDKIETVEIYMDKRQCKKYGFQDGYVKCLEDLGINHTIDGYGGKKLND